MLASSSQDCERPLRSWLCTFLSDHLCWHLSCSNNPSSSVRAFTVPTFNRILVLVLAVLAVLAVLVVLAVLAVLCLCPCRACLCFVCLCQTHRCPSGHLLLGVTDLSVSCFEHVRGLYTRSMFCFLLSRHHTNSVSHGSTAHVSRDHPATGLQVNSCECRPQECGFFLGHLADNSGVSRDLPSFRWHPSTQAALLAMATKSPSRDFVLVPVCTDHTFCATCVSSRSHDHLLLMSQRRSTHRP